MVMGAQRRMKNLQFGLESCKEDEWLQGRYGEKKLLLWIKKQITHKLLSLHRAVTSAVMESQQHSNLFNN